MAEQEHKDRALAKLTGIDHPLRLAIATSLSLRPMSANELADELGAPVGKVRYQLGRLRSVGLAELKEERQRRGVSERVYFVRAQPFSGAEMAQLTASQREKAIAAILKAVLNDTAKALRAGTFGGQRDFTLSRLPLALDERGWSEALAIHCDAQARLLDVRDRSDARIEEGERPTVDVFSLLFLFGMPGQATGIL